MAIEVMDLSKEEMEEKLIKWMNMYFDEKRKYNGYSGFLKEELFKDNNLFMVEDKAKLKRRLKKEKIFRDSKKIKINNMENK